MTTQIKSKDDKSPSEDIIEEIMQDKGIAQSLGLAAYQYQMWLLGEVFRWLSNNGYEVKKKSQILRMN